MTRDAVLPDAELLAVTILRANAALAALIGPRAYTELPANPTFPLVVLQRIGGAPSIRGWVDAARLQLEGYALTKHEARLVTATAQAAMHKAEGTTQPAAVIGAVDTLTGPRWVPDEPTDRPRYLIEMTINTHPRVDPS